MKKLICVVSLYLSIFDFACVYADPSKRTNEAFKPWQPKSVSMDRDRLVIVLHENKITKTIFESIITSGICTPIWLGEKTHIQQAKEVVILNRFQKQGFIFEKPESVCTKMGKLPERGAAAILAGSSRLY